MSFCVCARVFYVDFIFRLKALTSTCTTSAKRMILLHEALISMFGPLAEFPQEKFSVKDNSSKMWEFFCIFDLLLWCSWSKIHVSDFVPHVSSTPCGRCLSTCNETWHLWFFEALDLAQTKVGSANEMEREERVSILNAQRCQSGYQLLMERGTQMLKILTLYWNHSC